MTAQQDIADALAARLDAAEARIEAKLNQPAPVEAPVDFTALNAAADKLDALAPVPAADPGQPNTDPAPADPAPAPVAAAPAPVDVPAPDQSIPSVPLA